MIGKTIQEIQLQDFATQVVQIEEENVETFGKITNDYNPAHFDQEYAKTTMFKERISHGMYVGSLFSKLFGMDLQGNGSIYVSQTLKFKRPVYFGDTITSKVIFKDINL